MAIVILNMEVLCCRVQSTKHKAGMMCAIYINKYICGERGNYIGG
jgi:hypothetical protein